jgi:hypothetical protein
MFILDSTGLSITNQNSREMKRQCRFSTTRTSSVANRHHFVADAISCLMMFTRCCVPDVPGCFLLAVSPVLLTQCSSVFCLVCPQCSPSPVFPGVPAAPGVWPQKLMCLRMVNANGSVPNEIPTNERPRGKLCPRWDPSRWDPLRLRQRVQVSVSPIGIHPR